MIHIGKGFVTHEYVPEACPIATAWLHESLWNTRAPSIPLADAMKLRDALANIARQNLSMEVDDKNDHDFEAAYDMAVETAREAIADFDAKHPTP